MHASLFSFLAVFLASAAAAMGLGGGTVLLLYLSFFSSLGQVQMQAMNLLLFLPAAALSLYFHRKNGLICTSVLPQEPTISMKAVVKKAILYGILGGVLGGVGGSVLSNRLDPDFTGRAFAVFLLAIGLRELWLSGGMIVKKFRHRA